MPAHAPEEHFRHLRSLVEREEAEEIEAFHRDFVERSPEEREQAGVTLRRLLVQDISYSPAGHVLATLTRADGVSLPFYTLDVGDIATLSQEHSMNPSLPFGTVYDRDEKTITVSFPKPLPDWVKEPYAVLNRAYRRGTFRCMYEALDELDEVRHGRLAYMKALTFGQKTPRTRDTDPVVFFDQGLNVPQRKAVEMALAALDIAFIHGPPGTGKTTVLVEVIRQAHACGEFVFATAPSNMACDNLLEKLAEAKLPVLRLGHPARILRHLRDYTLDHQLALHPYAGLLEDLRRDLDELYKRRRRYSEKGKFTREVREDFKRKSARLKEERSVLRKQLFNQVIGSAQVIVGTHVGAAGEIFGDRVFDLVVMDEAPQATEPLSWVPLRRAKRAVLAGDHWQLPPTVRSADAERGGLSVSLFERLSNALPEEAKCLLTVQYRMHRRIMGFSSEQFYEGRLVADERVAEHALADLPHVKDRESSREPFLFIDTAGCGFEEALEPGSQSRLNREEAQLALSQLRTLFDLGMRREEIALISPYSAQVRYLESMFHEKGVEIGSVDGFQGREKEAVIVSLVRSNLEGELGFLVDRRRMNVALTRARRKLVVIGDSATLCSIPFYRDFFEYAEKVGGYRSAWEYLE